MKSVLMIGMGRFGQHLCRNLVELGNDVMIVDSDESRLDDLFQIVTSAKIGDCTKEEVLKSFGVGNFDICFVCIGTNFQSSLEVTSLLKDLGAGYVISKATRDIHAKFLLKNGADEVIYPDRDIAKRLARRVSANHVFDYIELGEYAIYEIPTIPHWVGKSIKQVDFRSKYNVSILEIKGSDGNSSLFPHPDYVFAQDEHLMVVGRKKDMDKILKQL